MRKMFLFFLGVFALQALAPLSAMVRAQVGPDGYYDGYYYNDGYYDDGVYWGGPGYYYGYYFDNDGDFYGYRRRNYYRYYRGRGYYGYHHRH
jgi:hypothetical protein